MNLELSCGRYELGCGTLQSVTLGLTPDIRGPAITVTAIVPALAQFFSV
jgi:hypothetical protein